MTTVGEAISRMRNTLKSVKEDPFLTDRVIYYSLIKYGQALAGVTQPVKQVLPVAVNTLINAGSLDIKAPFDVYKNNFILLNNNPKEANKEFNADLLEPYIKASTAIGKPKTPEEQAKSDADKAQLNKDIESMVKQLPKFDSIDTAKNKINEFIS